MKSIKQVAEETGLTAHTLRYYEKQGLMYPVPRDSSGHRVYREQDVHWLYFIQCLKKTGMPLKDIQDYTAGVIDKAHKPEYLLQILKVHKQRLEKNRAEIDDFLEHINWKINHYTELV